MPVRGRGPLAVGAVLLLAVAGGAGVHGGQDRWGHDPVAPLAGQVVDERGLAVAGATIGLGEDLTVVSDERGRFSADLAGGPRLVTASAPGHLPRTQAAEPGAALELVLTGRADDTVSLRFGGDVMFGRRYFDRDEDGDRSEGLLPPGASVADHAALLAHVRPLLADADLTVVNLETPLLDQPYVDPTVPRSPHLHPTKEFVFASAPESVQALLDVGVDVVSLGNNHVFDALDDGLEQTLVALRRAGMPHFGAGRTEDEAWAPALVERKGVRVAYLGCTTITGTEHPVPYVAGPAQGGAARCSQERLAREVRSARVRADTVVVMVHGGEEYEREQTELVRRLSSTAAAAGAALVVNGHPHVVGGVSVQGPALVAETLGNLLFDQTVWPTFLSYLLRVDVRRGVPVLATVDPLLLEDQLPRPTVGLLADAAARSAAGLPGDMRLQGPGAVLAPERAVVPLRGTASLPAGSVMRLAPGWWVEAPPAADDASLGVDLLWTGSFEDMDTDPRTSGAHQWAYGAHVERTAGAACRGAAGMVLRRSARSTADVVLTPEHRQLVPVGTALSLLVDVRQASAGGTVTLALYGDTRGPSSTTLRAQVPAGDHGDGPCRTVRLDVVVPPGTVAVQPFLRLAPHRDGVRAARLAVDDVRLVAWGPPDTSGRRYDTVEARADVVLDVVSDRADPLPGPFVDP